MSNQYGDYDLETIKNQIKKTEWEAVLAVFRYVRMATARQVERATGLHETVVRNTLNVLLSVEDVAQDTGHDEPRVRRILTKAEKRIAYRAWAGQGSVVYQLGRAGAALLREMGLIDDLRPSEQADPKAIAHSLCILDVILTGHEHGLKGLQVEKPLANGDGATIRADVALPEIGAGGEIMGWRLIEVEQEADDGNYARIVQRLQRWREFFVEDRLQTAGAPGAGAVREPPVLPQIVMLFNRRLGELAATLAQWQGALAEVVAHHGTPPFAVYYAPLWDFLYDPHWDGSGYARLHPAAKPITPVVDPLAVAPRQANLRGFFALVWKIYSVSRGSGDVSAEYTMPVGSLQALRAWLASAEMVDTREKLVKALGLIRAHTGPTIAVSVLNKTIWDVLLRQYGIDRKHIGPRGEMRFMAAPPEMPGSAVGYGDYHVRVSIDKAYFERMREQGLLPEGVTPSTLEAALEWVLGAPYTYAYELGLRQQAWLAGDRRKPKPEDGAPSSKSKRKRAPKE
jgi:hypothetical protein